MKWRNVPNWTSHRVRAQEAFSQKKKIIKGFPGGSVVKNPLANARDVGLVPGPGRSHMPWSN